MDRRVNSRVCVCVFNGVVVFSQGVRSSGGSRLWAEEPAGVPQGARRLPQVATGGRDHRQRLGRRLPEGGAVSGLRPHPRAEGSARSKYHVCSVGFDTAGCVISDALAAKTRWFMVLSGCVESQNVCVYIFLISPSCLLAWCGFRSK